MNLALTVQKLEGGVFRLIVTSPDEEAHSLEMLDDAFRAIMDKGIRNAGYFDSATFIVDTKMADETVSFSD